MQIIRTRLFFAFVCGLIFISAAHAQVYSGSLTGVVTDPAGAVVPGATAVVTDENKGFKFTTTAGSDGRYVLRNLSPGAYRLDVSAPGMRTYTRTGITITDRKSKRLNS